jgi:hypothetical protein
LMASISWQALANLARTREHSAPLEPAEVGTVSYNMGLLWSPKTSKRQSKELYLLTSSSNQAWLDSVKLHPALESGSQI